jgi:photosystem II stability/assembly factor-like uncharacterized protein
VNTLATRFRHSRGEDFSIDMKRSAALLAACVVAVLAMAAHGSAAVSVGHSGWKWGNPLPQGNTIRALDFNSGTGYAAGDFGTLLKTTDAGETWTGIPTGITSTLSRVDEITPQSVVIGGGCSARRSDDGGTTFHRLPFTPSELSCKQGIQSLSFPSSDAGFLLLHDGTLLSTSDGGSSFSRRTAIPNSAAKGGGETPTDIFFTSPTNGVAVSRANGGPGGIYHTIDGGNTWTQVPGAAGTFRSVWFADSNTGYAVGDGSLLYATVDGGADWSARPLAGAAPANFTSIRCAGVICLLATDTGSHLVRTTDAGFTASDVSPSNQAIFAAAFASPSQAVAAGQAGATVVSSDAGVTFSPIPASGGRIGGPFIRLRAASASEAFATGQSGTLARTTDGGETWIDLGVPTTGSVIDVSFPTAGTGYALDSVGTVLKSVNGGSSWSLLNTGTQAEPASILALDVRRVLLIGPRGVRRSTDGGDTFSAANGAAGRASLQKADVARGAVFAYGPHALFVSTNAGGSWKALKRPTRKALRTVDFISGKRGFALDAQGKVWSTANRGRHWTQLIATGTLSSYDLAFTAANRGYLAVNSFGIQRGGFLLKTSDGGQTWHPQLVSSHPLARNGIATTAGQTDFAMDNAGDLFSTTSGGDQGVASALRLKTASRLVRRGRTIHVNGKLTPAAGGEQVVVSARASRHGWVHKVVQVASNGTFTTVWRVSRFTIFVAQWAGDADHMGAGSRVLQVSVR